MGDGGRSGRHASRLKAKAMQKDRTTRVVMLGTGTPRPDPNRSGPATAIVVNDTPYLVDFGPGVIRRAAAAYQNGVTALGAGAARLTTAFLTHLHSDHTMGYPDLIFTPWLMGRREPLLVFGPKGLKGMTTNILKAWEIDLNARTQGGHARPPCQVNAHEIIPGIIYRDRNITVTAFPVHHGDALDAFGYRIETQDRTVVLSGDTAPTPSLLEHCSGCDVLIHEAYPLATFGSVSAAWQEFRRTHHTSSIELAEIANAVKPGLLVVYHQSNAGGGPTASDSDEILIEEIQRLYKGPVVCGHDLDVF
jgi:ribonuclease BN (tRNA processing enzyme)